MSYGKMCDGCGKFLKEGNDEYRKSFFLQFQEQGADIDFYKHFCSAECLKKWAGEYK